MDFTKSKEYIEWLNHCEKVQAMRSGVPQETPAEQRRRIERARRDYAFFVETYFSDLASCRCAQFHIDAANYLLLHPNTRAVFEWARGHAKSTHLGVFIPLWLKIQHPRTINTVIVVSKSQEAATKLLSDLQEQLQFNDLYIHDFGPQIKQGNWAAGRFITADDVSFTAYGRQQTPRGLKHKGNRPDYIVIDDIDDDEMVRNPRRVSETVEWCLTALLGTMAMGRGRFVAVGNRIAKNSVLTALADRPDTYHTVVNAIDRWGNPSWRENYTLDEIRSLREYMGERNFQKEYMNNPIIEGAVFSAKNIRYGKMLPLQQYRQLICYTDPSFKNSTTADYKATALVGKTSDGYFHVLRMFADQTSISNMIGWHYEIRSWIDGRVPVMYYMEANFIQDLFLDEFRKAGEIIGQHIPIIGDRRSKGDKFARIENMQPLFERNLILFNEQFRDSQGFRVLEEQLLMFERGSRIHDDAPDALESAVWLLARNTRTTDAKYIVGRRKIQRF